MVMGPYDRARLQMQEESDADWIRDKVIPAHMELAGAIDRMMQAEIRMPSYNPEVRYFTPGHVSFRVDKISFQGFPCEITPTQNEIVKDDEFAFLIHMQESHYVNMLKQGCDMGMFNGPTTAMVIRVVDDGDVASFIYVEGKPSGDFLRTIVGIAKKTEDSTYLWEDFFYQYPSDKKD